MIGATCKKRLNAYILFSYKFPTRKHLAFYVFAALGLAQLGAPPPPHVRGILLAPPWYLIFIFCKTYSLSTPTKGDFNLECPRFDEPLRDSSTFSCWKLYETFLFPHKLVPVQLLSWGKCYKAGREMGEYIGSNGGAVEYPENMITLITRTCSITLQTPWPLSASPPQNYLRAQDSFSVTNNHSHHCHLPHSHFHRKKTYIDPEILRHHHHHHHHDSHHRRKQHCYCWSW